MKPIKLTALSALQLRDLFTAMERTRTEAERAYDALTVATAEIIRADKQELPKNPVTLAVRGDDVFLEEVEDSRGAVDARVSGGAEPGMRPVGGEVGRKAAKHLPRGRK